MARQKIISVLLAILIFIVKCFEGVDVEAQTGYCRIVCDPFQSHSASHDFGTNGLVIPLSSSGQGARGPMGPPGKAGPPGPPGPKGVGSILRGPVAFYATLKGDFSKDDVLKFTNVVTNLGSHYNPLTGTFTCQSAGAYQFNYSVMKSGISLRADLVLNDSKIVASAVAVDALHTDTASNSAILQLNVGDQVYVRLSKSGSTFKDAEIVFSTFSGHLLYES